MNKVILMGRLTRDPEVRYTQDSQPMCIARYTLAVDRRYSHKENNTGDTADFISCVAFGKAGEFAEKYFRKGTKIIVTGRIQTGSYTRQADNQKIYTTDVVIEEQEFAESKSNDNNNGAASQEGIKPQGYGDVANESFMNIPDGIDGDLPFN